MMRKIGTISAITKHGEKNHSLYHHPIARQNLFWTLTLYDELQDIDSLKSFDYTRGEQFRAQETLRKYVEAKLHKKKRVFNSDQEKIKAIRELAKEYGWEEDSTLSPREKDSILLNLDYEITEETFKFYKNGNNEG